MDWNHGQAKLATRRGFEPRLEGPKPPVLPLHHRVVFDAARMRLRVYQRSPHVSTTGGASARGFRARGSSSGVRLPVDAASVSDDNDKDCLAGIFDFVNDSVVGNADSPRLTAAEFLHTGGPRCDRKRTHCSDDSVLEGRWDLGERFLRRSSNEDRVRHFFALPRIRFTVSSKGTAPPASALALS